jgi:hypothetical protein
MAANFQPNQEDMPESGLPELRLKHTTKCANHRMDEQSVKYLDVTVENPGNLESLIGTEALEVDSLVVRGSINDVDFRTMWNASLNGVLSVINLENASIADNKLPDYAFCHLNEQLSDDKTEYYVIRLRRIILPEGVEEIGEMAFEAAGDLEMVNIPSSMKKLGKYCFGDCSSLGIESLVLPEGLELIDEGAFTYCSNLNREVALPSTLKQIGDYAFYLSAISGVTFNEGLERLGGHAFSGCKLKSVVLPNSCVNFGDGSQFSTNLELEYIHLPEGMTEIPFGFAKGCISLKEINIPDNVSVINHDAFLSCEQLQSLELPEGVKSVYFNAFSGLKAIEEMVFPSSLEFLGINSCEAWSNVKRIYCKALVPPTCDTSDDGRTPFGKIEDEYAGDTPKSTPLYVPVGTGDLYRNAAGWSYFTNIIETNDFPGASVERISAEQPVRDNSIYDLLGRKVTHPVAGEIYIQAGKKLIFSK